MCYHALAAADAQSVRRPGRVVDISFFDLMRPIVLPEGSSCPLRRAGARYAGVVRTPVVLNACYAGVVRTPVVLIARYGQRDSRGAWFSKKPVMRAWFCAGPGTDRTPVVPA
jgi:hypothetical protein